MPAKITRLDARRDPEAVEWAKELRETETWFHSERFGHITRLHTPFEVVSLRGTLQEGDGRMHFLSCEKGGAPPVRPEGGAARWDELSARR